MSEAGRSAGTEARRLVAVADEHERRATEAREAAERWTIAHRPSHRAAGGRYARTFILRAEASLCERPIEGVSAVVVDEAQDLSCAMIRMLYALVGDRPDGLTLIGDGQQTVYPGGYTLSEAGLTVAGRGMVLSTNYRNTREIAAFAAFAAFAATVVEGDEFVDIEGGALRGDAAVAIPRTGPVPTSTVFASLPEHDAALVAHTRSLIASGVSADDIGVLCSSNRDAEACAGALRRAGVEAVMLTDCSGVVTDRVKVGTIKRAKGLEFKQVLVARVLERLLTPVGDGLDDGARERWEIERRELYVGMTRARDGLWVGLQPQLWAEEITTKVRSDESLDRKVGR